MYYFINNKFNFQILHIYQNDKFHGWCHHGFNNLLLLPHLNQLICSFKQGIACYISQNLNETKFQEFNDCNKKEKNKFKM